MDGSYSDQTQQDKIQVASSDRNCGLAQTIAQMYIATVPVLIQVMRDAATEGNLRDLFRAADALHLSSANIGARRLADLCQNIRNLPSKAHLRNVPAQLDEIAQLAEKVCLVIQRNHTIVPQHEFV